MQEKAKEPEIRFAGFTGAWEQRKIGDYLTLSKIPGHTGVDAKKLTVKLWGKGVVEKTDIYGGSQNTQYYVRRAGQFMYGKLDFLHAAFGIVPKSLDRFESTLDSPAFDLHEIDGAFLQNRVTQQNFYLKFGNIANGSRKAKRIHEVTFLDMPIVVPSYAEQKKIGAFLNKLDSLLTLHQRKYEKLLNIKKSMLEKMFPKEGEVVPEIRFKGFTGAWEQRKLNEIADVYDGVHQTPKYTSSGVRFLSVENIATLESEKYISEADFIRDFKIFPQKGDILMTRIGDIGTAKVIKSDEKYAFYVSLALLKPKHINSDFLCNSIASKNFQKGLKARSLLTAIPLKINKEEIGKVATSFPLNLSEQEKIGSFFNHIESLLTLHQRKLEMLKNVKQAFLEKMFV